MKKKTKDILLISLFIALIVLGFFVNIIVKDKNISVSERRKLKQFPKITIKRLMEGKISNDFETYAMDQFVGRDFFRNIKAITNFNILRKKDNNGYFMKNNIIYKQTGKLKENEVNLAINKINNVKEKYLKDNKVYYAIVPDKCYYLQDYELKMDYNKLEEMLNENLKDIKYINIFDILSKNDYYNTDTHWKQESILKIAKKISKAMTGNFEIGEITINNKGEFNGVYSGQIGLPIKEKDTLKYITTPEMENCTTLNYETNSENKIYDEEKWNNSQDKYDYFLSGPTPLISINNPNQANGKELIIFRDSFGSSLAPLLAENYSKITLVDLRYISESKLEEYIDFTNQDVLFIYSTLVLNEGSIFK